MYPDRIFTTFDILAPEVKLNIGGNRSIRTKTGACLTVAFLSTLVFASFFIFRTYLRTDTPSSLNETFHQPTYPKIDLVKHKILPVVIGYLGDTESILAEDMKSYLTLVAARQNWYSDIDENGEAITKLKELFFEVVPCSSLGEDNLELYDYFGKDTYLFEMITLYGMCIKPDEGLFVQGKGSDDLFDLISLRFKPCSLPTGCKPASDIEKLNFYITVPQTSFDQGNFEEPFSRSVNADVLYYLNPSMVQYYNTRIKFNIVKDFRGVLPSWKERSSFYDIKDTFYNAGSRDPSQVTCDEIDVYDSTKCVSYLEMMFQSSGSVSKINRRYKTLTETFGELGGIKEVLLLVFVLIYYRFNLNARDQYLIDHVYGFADSQTSPQTGNNDKETNDNIPSSLDLKFSVLRKRGTLQRLGRCLRKKTDEEKRKAAIRESAIESVRSNLNVINIIKELNNLKVVCQFLFRGRHYKLSPAVQFNLHRRLVHEAKMMKKVPYEKITKEMNPDMNGINVREGNEINPEGDIGQDFGLLDENKVKLMTFEEAMKEIEDNSSNSFVSPPADMIEHQLDRFFYRCMKETDEYIHKKMEEAERVKDAQPSAQDNQPHHSGSSSKIKPKPSSTDVNNLKKEGVMMEAFDDEIFNESVQNALIQTPTSAKKLDLTDPKIFENGNKVEPTSSIYLKKRTFDSGFIEKISEGRLSRNNLHREDRNSELRAEKRGSKVNYQMNIGEEVGQKSNRIDSKDE